MKHQRTKSARALSCAAATGMQGCNCSFFARPFEEVKLIALVHATQVTTAVDSCARVMLVHRLLSYTSTESAENSTHSALFNCHIPFSSPSALKA